MKFAPIKNEKEYQVALKKLEKVFDASPNSPEGDMAQVLVLLIEDYEKKHFPIEDPDPIKAIEYMMEERGLNKEDIINFIGNRRLTTKVMNRQKGLSLRMIKALHK